MAQTVESLTNEILSKVGASTLTDLITTLPSALTTGAYLNETKEILDKGKEEEAFHQLSLTHSTRLHHRLAQKLHNPKQQDEEVRVEFSEDLQERRKKILSATTKDETMRLLQKLPPEWTVVQITSVEDGKELFSPVGSPASTPTLYVSRCVCGPNASVIVQPITTPKNKSVCSFLQEMTNIKSNIKSSFVRANLLDPRQRTEDKKEALNLRMKNLVKSMEMIWLQWWSCLLVGSLHPKEERTLDKLTSQLISTHKLNLTDSQKHRLKCILSCPMSEWVGEAKDWVRSVVATVLGESIKSGIVKDVCTSINKAKDLLTPLRKATRNPLILVLDKTTVALPWEMMMVMRNQPVTRMPSVRMLVMLYEHHSNQADSVLVKGVNVRDGFYLLDPEGNLPRTRDRLEGLLAKTGWPGITCRVPTHQEFSSALANNDVFLYAGHGSGSQYLPGELVEKVMCRSLVLLFGCSSVRLLPRGRIPDPWGVVMHYFIANCPCVVGMLWEVTDRATDHLTIEMIQTLQTSLQDDDSSVLPDVPLLVARSRLLPKHFIMASAFCAYGLPLHLVNSSDSSDGKAS